MRPVQTNKKPEMKSTLAAIVLPDGDPGITGSTSRVATKEGNMNLRPGGPGVGQTQDIKAVLKLSSTDKPSQVAAHNPGMVPGLNAVRAGLGGSARLKDASRSAAMGSGSACAAGGAWASGQGGSSIKRNASGFPAAGGLATCAGVGAPGMGASQPQGYAAICATKGVSGVGTATSGVGGSPKSGSSTSVGAWGSAAAAAAGSGGRVEVINADKGVHASVVGESQRECSESASWRRGAPGGDAASIFGTSGRGASNFSGPARSDAVGDDGWENWMGDAGDSHGDGQNVDKDASRDLASNEGRVVADKQVVSGSMISSSQVPGPDIAPSVMRPAEERSGSGIVKADQSEGRAPISETEKELRQASPSAQLSPTKAASPLSSIKTSLVNPWAVARGDIFSNAGMSSPKTSSRDKDSLQSPSKKLGWRKHRHGEERWKMLSIERVKCCLMALEGSTSVPGMPRSSIKGRIPLSATLKAPIKAQESMRELRSVRDKMLDMQLPWKELGGEFVPTVDMDQQRENSVQAMDKERALAKEEDEKEARLGGPSGPWLKKQSRLKLDYNKHSDYGSWFLTKFKSEFVPLSKADAFEDLRVLNSTWTDASNTVERTMRGRERKMPKHMRDNAAPWQVLIPGRKGKEAPNSAAGVAAPSKPGRDVTRGRGEGDEEGEEEDEKEDSRRGSLSIKSRTTIMTDLPAGWSGRAVTRQSSSQADIWMMAPDGSKLRSVVEVDNWYAMNNKVLSRSDRKIFEEACRVVRRKAAKLHEKQMGREVSSDDDETRGQGAGRENKGGKMKEGERSDGKGKGSMLSPRSSAKSPTLELSELKTICWDCKKGKFAQKHFSRSQCRQVHGHTACDWREDPRQLSKKDKCAGGGGGGAMKEVRMGEGGRCTKCGKVWVEEEEGGEDMRENGLLVCEDCRTVPPARSMGDRGDRQEDEVSGEEDDENGRNSARSRGKKSRQSDEEGEEEDDDDDDEEEVYEAEDDETVAEIAARLGCDAHEMLRLNKGRYTGLTLNSRLFAGTLLLLPQSDNDKDDDSKGARQQVGRKRKGFTSSGSRGLGGGKGKRRQRDWSDSEDEGQTKSGCFTTAHGHRRWGNRWGSGVIDPRCHGLSTADRPMQCSYSKCAMPTHSGRGDGEHGWKIVTSQTRAGNQDWGRLIGRVFCNACFMQFATRGTLVRPGRATTKDGKDSGSEALETPRDRDGRDRMLSPGKSPDGVGGSGNKEFGRPRVGTARKLRQDEEEDKEAHLFRPHQGKKGKGRMRCCLKACPEGADGGRWMLVNEKTNAGARDWSRHIGRTFCKACFMYFANAGTFAGRGEGVEVEESSESSESEESEDSEDEESDGMQEEKVGGETKDEDKSDGDDGDEDVDDEDEGGERGKKSKRAKADGSSAAAGSASKNKGSGRSLTFSSGAVFEL
jgi:hypothetical protein